MTEHSAPRVDIQHRAGEALPDDVYVAIGARIAVTLHGSPSYGWEPVQVDGAALTAIESAAQDGTVRTIWRAEHPGVAELRATASFRGDRFGPQTRLWRVTVHVIR